MLERLQPHLYNVDPYNRDSHMITRRFLIAGMTGAAGALVAPPLLHLTSMTATASNWEKPDDQAIGEPESPIYLIEYFSLTCSHCRDFHLEIFPRLRTEYIDTGKVRFISRDFPLNRPALDAAILAQCAGPDRYFAFIETLFNTFDNWTRAADYLKVLGQIAQLGGISEAEFKDCLGNGSIEAKIFNNMLDAQETYDVSSTPTFIINGTKQEGGANYEKFSKTLDNYLPDT